MKLGRVAPCLHLSGSQRLPAPIEHHRRAAGAIVFATGLALLAASPVRAAILSFDASCAVTVQELIDSVPASLTSDSDSATGATDPFPAAADARLVSTDLEDRVLSFGLSIAEVADPTASGRPNPEEFGLEVDCYSDTPSVSYTLGAAATEVRKLVFSRDPAVDPFPVDFDEDGGREVESTVYFGGAMIFWALDGGPDLAGLSGDLKVVVTRVGTEAPLFQAGIALDGGDGAEGDPDVTGGADVEVGGLELLADGADAETLEALSAFEAAGTVRVVLVPYQEHTYRYQVLADEEFELRAEFSASVSNAPAGSGAAGAWGRDFAELGDLLSETLPQVDGKLIEQALNRAAREVQTGQPTTPTGLCGSLGAAAFLLPATLLALGRRAR